jgi:hypothetical protein
MKKSNFSARINYRYGTDGKLLGATVTTRQFGVTETRKLDAEQAAALKAQRAKDAAQGYGCAFVLMIIVVVYFVFTVL